MWRSIVGRWQGVLGRIIHQDRLDALLLATLSAFSFWWRPDIVHVFRWELAFVLPWADRRGFASVYSELAVPAVTPESGQGWRMHVADLRRATMITALSKAVEKGLRQVTKTQRRIVIIPPFVRDAPDEFPSALSHVGNTTITCIARLSPEKGLNYLMLAAAPVVGARKGVTFLIAGGGPLREALIQQAESLGIGDKVRFYGVFPRHDLFRIMAMTDILVLPSLTEGMGYAIVEAMAYGKPVVATAVGGVPEVVKHQKTGLLVPPRDPRRLAEALMILVDDEEMRVQMGMAGRRSFLAGRYSVEAFVAANLAVYEQARSLTTSSNSVVQEQ